MKAAKINGTHNVQRTGNARSGGVSSTDQHAMAIRKLYSSTPYSIRKTKFKGGGIKPFVSNRASTRSITNP
jgi:hypothetical protein